MNVSRLEIRYNIMNRNHCLYFYDNKSNTEYQYEFINDLSLNLEPQRFEEKNEVSFLLSVIEDMKKEIDYYKEKNEY